MANSKSKVSLRVVIILGLGLFLAGYIVGTFLPAPVFGSESFMGATRPGSRSHRR